MLGVHPAYEIATCYTGKVEQDELEHTLHGGRDGFAINYGAAGIGAGAALLVGVYGALLYFGLRVPLKPFFAVTSGVLYYMAFVFAGKGVAELQAGGVVSLTPVAGAPRLALLGIYPTVESLLLQGVLAGLAIAALLWLYLKPSAAGGQPSAAPAADLRGTRVDG